jgi:predicted unusual protein kinase regulating ubiquinone biosynthesis (AarF/ABC1/UbiB family)
MTKREVRARRGARIALPTGPAGQTSGETVAAALARKRRQKDAEPYEQLVARYAGVAVRAGQLLWTATVGTDLPAATLSAVKQGCTEDAPVMPPELTARTVRTELGRPPHEVFAEFDPAPFATGAICQVHAAVLPDGRRVVVKIRYRGAAQALRTALAGGELRAVLDPHVLAAAPDLTAADVQRAASELRGRVEESIGLLTESAVARIPDVMPELSTERVLTMARVDPLGKLESAWKAARMGETR